MPFLEVSLDVAYSQQLYRFLIISIILKRNNLIFFHTPPSLHFVIFLDHPILHKEVNDSHCSLCPPCPTMSHSIIADLWDVTRLPGEKRDNVIEAEELFMRSGNNKTVS